MNKLNGGYVMIDLNDTNNIYTRAKNAIGCGKPIMVFDDPECYYADSISLNGDGDVVIIKGGKTININDANTVISEGSVSNPTMENIVDLSNRKRFVEGDLTLEDISGLTSTYAKYSLSGTHLMLQIAFSVTTSTVLSGVVLARLASVIPSWILDKLIPISGVRYAFTSFSGYNNDLSQTQSLPVSINKSGSDFVITFGNFTATYDLNFRVQFDFLIDAE